MDENNKRDMTPEEFYKNSNYDIDDYMGSFIFAEAYHKAEMTRKIERINNITQPSFSEILNELKQ